MLGQLIGFAVLAVVARRVGPANLGVYTFAQTFALWWVLPRSWASASSRFATSPGTRRALRRCLAHDLLVWAQALLLDGELAKAEPKRLRYRLFHVAARLAFHGRRAKLHLQHDWPWAEQLLAAFQKLKALPTAAG